LARQRIRQEMEGTLRTRPMDRPVYDPVEAGNSLTAVPWKRKDPKQMTLFEKRTKYRKER
ncbi:MAG TPA: hypothetical protein P5573_07090, partial [Syntrophales bacterium]|nr:hypothetical protein [Syntrophales bacterium]